MTNIPAELVVYSVASVSVSLNSEKLRFLFSLLLTVYCFLTEIHSFYRTMHVVQSAVLLS